MRITPAAPDRLDEWAALRVELFPEDELADHHADTEHPDRITFLALDIAGTAQGFAEASMRHDYVNGLHTSPAAFLEALYVRPPFRRAGAARLLVAAVESWARSLDLEELGSDALLENEVSHAMHHALGFKETERVVYFRRRLTDGVAARG